jgi:DNA-binding LacI/PurR family transcriptional regulator
MRLLNKEESEALQLLRMSGHAVVVFTLKDLKGVPSEALEEFLEEEGAHFIKSCQPDQESTRRRRLTAYEEACRDAGVPPFGPIRG